MTDIRDIIEVNAGSILAGFIAAHGVPLLSSAMKELTADAVNAAADLHKACEVYFREYSANHPRTP